MRRVPFMLVFSILVSGCGEDNSRKADEAFVMTIPIGLDAGGQYIPQNNPMTVRKIELGRRLFFDARLSLDGTVACATCHNPSLGFADGRAFAIGIYGQEFKRGTPTLINRLFSREQFWDGRSKDLEDQVRNPIENELEMGNTVENMVRTLNQVEEYRIRFRDVFGGEISMENVAMAIAAFERTLVSGNSFYDQYKNGKTDALSESAKRGAALFESDRVNCIKCHLGPNFTDEKYHNNGTGMDKEEPDWGRYEVTKNDSDRGAFKTPTLRDMSRTAPYMHNGSLRTLREVVEYYNKGGIPNRYLSPHMIPLKLTNQEIEDLVNFMKSLSGTNELVF